jgi:hypothetical protein
LGFRVFGFIIGLRVWRKIRYFWKKIRYGYADLEQPHKAALLSHQRVQACVGGMACAPNASTHTRLAAAAAAWYTHRHRHVHAHEQSKVENTSQVLTHVPMSGGAANARAYSRTRKHAHSNMRANVRKYKRVFTPPQQQMCTAGAGGWPGCTYLHPRTNAATNAFACVYTAKDSHTYTYNFARAHSKCIVTVRHTLTVLTCHAMYANRTRTCF